MSTRRVALLTAAVLALALAVGSGGFSTTNAQRSVSVAVVDDADAYLAVEHAAGDGTLTVGPGRGRLTDGLWLLDVGNQFSGTPLSVTVGFEQTGARRVTRLELRHDGDTVNAVGAGNPSSEGGNASTSRTGPASGTLGKAHLAPGEDAALVADVDCTATQGATTRLQVTVDATGPGASVDLDRTVTVECPP
ncbi:MULTISPECIES: hypothetical protein [Salinibaculum]|uniref:hypothetical protein n=1 Tax=Salinibaculum TaxID=2732368 RepID=UPI0030CE7F38